jgi:hypothetical protein
VRENSGIRRWATKTMNVIADKRALKLAALAAACVLASAAASAATQAQCEQQYAAKKAAGQTGPKSKAAFVKACLTAADPKPAGAAASQGGGEANKLPEDAENPVADLISVQFQNNLNFGFGPNNAAQNDLNFQPVIPIHLNDAWNIIARPITPVLYQPRLAPDLRPEFGLGNIEPEIFLSPAHPGKLIWGVGPALYLPTATGKTLGVNAWGAGPGVVGLTIQEPWVVGVVANNVLAWRNGQQVDEMTVQYFINYNLEKGWYLCSQPVITADWRAPTHDKWVVPFGGGVGRLFRVDGLPPINAQLQAFYNAVRPTVGPLTGPTWELRFQVSFLFPTGNK